MSVDFAALSGEYQFYNICYAFTCTCEEENCLKCVNLSCESFHLPIRMTCHKCVNSVSNM